MTATATPQNTTRPARAVAAVLALILGAMILLGSLVATIPLLTSPFNDMWNGTASLITSQLPFEQDPTNPVDEPMTTYTGVLVSSGAELTVPRLLIAGQGLLQLLVIYAAGATIALLALRLLRSKPFARVLRWGLVTLGGLIMLFAAVGPQLTALASDLGVTELGLPLYSALGDGVLTEHTPDTIMLNLWDPIWIVGRIDVVPFLLGVVITMIGFLIADGERMQKDTEGLI